MAVDMFLILDGVKGESEDKNHPKQIGGWSWSWGTSCDGSAHVGGGPPSIGKVNGRTCKVTK
jgi:type VI secretion system secreted protein Hcp